MELQPTAHFVKCYKKLPISIQRRVDKQLDILLCNFRHPSLRVKKIKGREDIWEARVTEDYRFTFQITGNTFILRRVGKHKETLKRP